MLKKILVYAAGMSSLFAASGRVLLLDDFENAASLRNWKGDIRFRADRASHGRSSAQVRFTERRTDVSLSGMAADWRGDDRLLFEVYNGRKDIFTVTFRIYDDAAAASGARRDYFEAGGQLLLLSGWNDVELKLAGLHAASYQRQLALDPIRRITIAVERRAPAMHSLLG